MSSQTDLQLSPSHPVGLVCTIPWCVLAVFVALMAGEHGHVLLALIGPILAGAVFQYRRQGLLLGPGAVTGLRVANGQLYARKGCGSEWPVVPVGESRVSSRFAILKVRRSGTISGTHVVVLADARPWFSNTSPEAFRQLRVWLRLGLPSAAEAPRDRPAANVQEIH